MNNVQSVIGEIISTPQVLAFLILWFFLGRLVGRLTVRLSWWKVILGLIVFPIIWPDLWSMSPVLLAIFLAGMLSNHTETIRGILGWSEGISDMLFALRHRLAYAEIRRLEEENEALKAKLRAAQMQDGGQSGTQQQWKQQARSWRSQGDGSSGNQSDGGRGAQGKTYGTRFSQGTSSTSSKGSAANGASGPQRGRSHSSSSSKAQGAGSAQGRNSSRTQNASSGQNRQRGASGQSQSQSSTQSKPSFTLRDQHLQTLGLRPGQTYSAAEIKAAWRKRAKETHPDAGGSKAAFIAVVNAYNALK